jgi:phosphoribosylanthranilate isomerase
MTPRVKICGVTRIEDGLLAAELGATAIGLVFWPGSPRFIDPSKALAIVDVLPPEVERIGVFVDQPVNHVAEVTGLLSLSAIQLHGAESPADYTRAAVPIIKSVAVHDNFDPATVAGLPRRVTVLLDAHDPVRRGGTGRTIDWSMAAAVAATRRTILSGGLNASNVRTAVDQVQPYMIDVSSGVESAPGVKDPGKLRDLFAALHRPAGAEAPGSGLSAR